MRFYAKLVSNPNRLFLFDIGMGCEANEARMDAFEQQRFNRLENGEVKRHCPEFFTPCAGPMVKNGKDIHLAGDFIYWMPKIDNLVYAKEGLTLKDHQQNAELGKPHEVSFRWRPGFKGEIGWNFGHGGWDMLFQYTRLYTSVSHHLRNASFLPAFDAFADGSYEDYFNQADAHAYLHYQIGDLELGRNYYVSPTLKLRPFIGAKTTCQKQNGKFDYNTDQSAVESPSFFTRTKHYLWGVGMRGGVGTSWQFSRYVGLYGDLALSGMWLHYKVGRKDTGVPPKSIEDQSLYSILNIQNRLRMIKPVMEFACGVRAETYSRSGRYHFLIQAGWEGHTWMNQTLHITNKGEYSQSDLTVHGLTAKARVDF